MGYRSRVYIAVPNKFPLPDDVINSAAEAIEACKDNKSHFFSYDRDKFDNHTLFIFEDVKWYDGHPEIKMWNDLVDMLDDEELNKEPFFFIRLGEEGGDIDERGDPWDFDVYTYSSNHVDGLDNCG